MLNVASLWTRSRSFRTISFNNGNKYLVLLIILIFILRVEEENDKWLFHNLSLNWTSLSVMRCAPRKTRNCSMIYSSSAGNPFGVWVSVTLVLWQRLIPSHFGSECNCYIMQFVNISKIAAKWFISQQISFFSLSASFKLWTSEWIFIYECVV